MTLCHHSVQAFAAAVTKYHKDTMTNTAVLLAMILLAFSLKTTTADESNGRYIHKKYGDDDGSYKRPRDEGKYIHVHIPYDGGYGPYSGDWERYKHQGDGNLDGSASNQKPVTVKPSTTTTPHPTIKYINNGNRIIRQNQLRREDGFKYLYETENKILAEENAIVKNEGTADEGIATKGFYQYVGPDGVLYKVTFTADENGFLPKMTRVKYPESLDHGFTKIKF